MKSHCARRARPLLGTIVEIEAGGQGVLPAIEAAFAAVARVHTLMSPVEPESDLVRLHAAPVGRWVKVHPWTARVLRAARRFYVQSCGAFDPVAGGGGSMADVEMGPRNRVRLKRAVRIDLGGIAKGFAVDRACEVLRRSRRVRAGSVNAGGDLRCFGRRLFVAQVRDPRAKGLLAFSISLREAALATTAPAHAPGLLRGLVNPRTGKRHRGTRSVTVGARSALLADALTKVALLAPRSVAVPLLRRHDARAFLIDSRGLRPI